MGDEQRREAKKAITHEYHLTDGTRVYAEKAMTEGAWLAHNDETKRASGGTLWWEQK